MATASADAGVGALLRDWRERRRRSQLNSQNASAMQASTQPSRSSSVLRRSVSKTLCSRAEIAFSTATLSAYSTWPS